MRIFIANLIVISPTDTIMDILSQITSPNTQIIVIKVRTKYGVLVEGHMANFLCIHKIFYGR